MKDFICPECGQSFKGYGNKRKYCSKICLAKVNRRNYRNENRKETKFCIICDKKFIAYRSNNRKTCSHSCAAKDRNSKYKYPRGKDSPAWKGGLERINKNLRGHKVHLLWRQAVLVRDNHKCVLCGKSGNIADHIKPFSKYPELRLDINNGRTLCESCHRKTDTYLSGTIKLRV